MDFLEEELQEILKIFREESEEYLQKLNQNLLKLEASPKDNGIISSLFREAHSLKGAARMIGLNDIQLIAHKIEDIFGLAREKTLNITPEIIDVLCKSVDCINSVIDECIETRGQSHCANVDVVVAEIEAIKKLAGEDDSYVEANSRSFFNQEELISEAAAVLAEELNNENLPFDKILELRPKVSSLISKLKTESSNTTLIRELYQLVTTIYNIIQVSDNWDIKEFVNDAHSKLDGVVRGSGMLLEIEIEEIELSLNEFFSYFNNKPQNLTNQFSIEKINYQIDKQEKIIENDSKTLEQESINNTINIGLDAVKLTNNINKSDFVADLKFISNNIVSFSETLSDSNSNVDLIIKKLKLSGICIIDENIKKIFESITEFIEFLKNENTKPSVEIAEVLKQSFDTACLMLSSSTNSIIDDPNLIVQRINILYQMLKISENELMAQKEENDEFNGFLGNNLALVEQRNEIFPKGSGFSTDIVESKQNQSTTIKTIRVDTQKLDYLVNQVGELIIAKIKSKEHLAEIEKITRYIEDWYREWGKAKKLIKYIDKKPAKTSDMPSGVSVYSQNKNIFTFFEESSLKITTFMNKMNILYKTIQEDETRLNLIVNELEEGIKSVRVLPLATIFHMFPRMVRDISREKNKEIEFIVLGSETSVDKKILEEIKSPLIHIIRNAIDHGVEGPEERLKSGKSAIGRISLSASHLENSVLIEISDDGKGIDLEAIKNKVLQKGLLTPAELQSMNDDQIMNIIFWPGFSTGDVITDISGRGIGLDIVYTKITQLSGKVNIKSIMGQGCTVSIQLPVTMATVKSFLVKINQQTFAIPTNAIKKTLLINHAEIIYKEGKETIIVDNKIVPICRLSRILEMNTILKKEEKMVIIVVEAEDVQVGFIVEKLLGDQEILHKNLTSPLLRVRNVAGVTTLGSGELCLILNVNDIVKSAYYIFGMSKKELIINRESSTSLVQRNILVVDDSVTTRILERNILRTAGYNVTVAINGLDALTKLYSQEFDLIVTDVEMPEINGFELTERIRNDERFKNIPIILLTSLASDADKKRGINLGADTYITKGYFDQEELLSTIRKLLASKFNA